MKIRLTESWPAGRTIGLSISLSLDDREILIHFLLHGISIKLWWITVSTMCVTTLARYCAQVWQSRRVTLEKQSLNQTSMKNQSSMSPILKRYIVTFESGRTLKLFATDRWRALDLCAIMSSMPIESIKEARVQIKVEPINPN